MTVTTHFSTLSPTAHLPRQDGQESFYVKVSSDRSRSHTASLLVSSSLVATASISSVSSASSISSTASTPTTSGIGDTWLAIDETYSESLVNVDNGEAEAEDFVSSIASVSTLRPESARRESSPGRGDKGSRGYWKSFIDGIQRVVIFTLDGGVIDRIKAANSYSKPLFDVSLSLEFVGVSLVDNRRMRELAYISLSQ